MEGPFTFPVKGVFILYNQDQSKILTQIPIDGQIEAAEIPSAATGKTVVIHVIEFAMDGKPDQVDMSTWCKVVLGAQTMMNDLHIRDPDMQEKVELAGEEYLDHIRSERSGGNRRIVPTRADDSHDTSS